ncbi:thiamine diphosphokinase [Oricola thermophila]|uniref:Thiamine diphosphokinase n=1 Tax=Oricola thermophila TaxID=2742145 RepID=A0A6N1VGT0_9HYPH|nr:thiamine diphosphokinase [Oricola thermophila]QKV20110.1 thiamine diphosphokinase [Oricola thermophila]
MTQEPATRFAILLDGALAPTDRLLRQMEGSRLLAADGGIRHAETLGREPELWLGDFDSAGSALDKRFRHVPRAPYPRDKAVSDGQIAVRHALEEGAREIIFVGALGGDRSDHALFNLAGASDLARAHPEVSVMLTSGREEAVPLLPGRPLRPDWPAGSVFSVVGFTPLSGLTVRNAKWPLEAVNVPFGSTWTLSNVAGEGVEILLKDGCGMTICQLQ